MTEKTCEEVLGHLENEVPEGDDEEDTDRLTVLKIACMAAVEPTLTDVQALSRLNKAFMLESPEACTELYVNPDMLADVVEKNRGSKSARVCGEKPEN